MIATSAVQHFPFRQATDPGALKPSNLSHSASGGSLSVVASPMEIAMSLRMSRFVSQGFVRPALTREHDPKFWDEHQASLAQWAKDREAQEPANWLQGRQIAILLIERSAMALDCIAHLSGSTSRASQYDFAWLRKNGYAVKPLGGRYHQLTPRGVRAARDCASQLALRLGLHHITYHFDSMNEHTARCSCGWHASAARTMNRNWRAPLEAAASRHLADPDAWKRSQARTEAAKRAAPVDKT